MNRIIAALAAGLLVGAAAAQTTIAFWHSMAGDEVESAITTLVEAFHAAQDQVRVDARYVGSYPDAQTRLVADFYPGLWAYGEFGDARYGLPWNASTPVMYYNVDALRQAGVAPPGSLEEFAAAAAALTGRTAQGAMFVGDSWLFEMTVLSRGGVLAFDDGSPNLDGPEAVAALTMLRELAQAGHLAFYGTNEQTPASLAFVRTRSLITFASIANWPDVRRFSIGFELAAGPVPMAEGGSVPLGGAQLVVLRNASEAERRALEGR